MCIYVYIYVYMYVYIYMCMYVYIYVYMYMYIYTHTYVHIDIYIYIYTHVCIYVYIYIYTHMKTKFIFAQQNTQYFRALFCSLPCAPSFYFAFQSSLTLTSLLTPSRVCACLFFFSCKRTLCLPHSVSPTRTLCLPHDLFFACGRVLSPPFALSFLHVRAISPVGWLRSVGSIKL